jgi:penicillin amidase
MGFSRLLFRLALGRRLPVTAGELRIRGPVAPVTVRRDKYGVPHIDAESDHDAFFALGFCQAQDRAAQLEVLWRVGRGRLAEWVGPAGLDADRMSRRIGFRRAAEKQLPVLDEFVRGQITAFAAGITAGNTAGLPKKPHEFAILGGEPSAWDAIDVLALLKLQSFLLPSNWDVELARLKILLADGLAAVGELDPTTVSWRSRNLLAPDDPSSAYAVSEGADLQEHLIVNTPSLPVIDHLVSDLAALQSFAPPSGGSNNWVIAGSRTQSGKPILASDPHLAPSAPPPWHLSHVRTPEWEAAGAQLVGAPGFGIGHNGFCAWGVTAGLTDNTDLFLETLGPDKTSVREADGSFRQCGVVREVIRVKGGSDVAEEVLITPRGPIITPLIPGLTAALSMRAVWLDPLPISGFLSLPRARSFHEFRRCFDKWPLLPLNVLYADTEGATGWQLIGQLPRRRGGHGLLPRPADRTDSGWAGLVPFDTMPFLENPAQGHFATANNAPPARIYLGSDYCDPYRARAVHDALAARDGWTVADCLALQLDVRCIPWEGIREAVLSLKVSDSDARDALELLRAWDGRVDADSPAACVFELFTAEMCVRVAKAKAPNAWRAALGEFGLTGVGHSLFTDRRVAHLVGLVRTQPSGWFASWPAEMESALGDVVRKLRREVGPGPAFWGWGHLRQLRLEHPLFGKHRWLGPVFNLGPVPCGGDCNTISQAGARPADPTGFTHNMANMRTVFDLSDVSKSQFVLCGGQSGNPWSDHYDDQFRLWQAGEAIPIAWDQATVIREAKETLRLLPGNS